MDNATASQSWNTTSSAAVAVPSNFPTFNATLDFLSSNQTYPVSASTSMTSTMGINQTSVSALSSLTPSVANMTDSPAFVLPLTMASNLSESHFSPLPVSTTSSSSLAAHNNTINSDQLRHESWKRTGLLLGVGCAVIGIICVLMGVAFLLRRKRGTSRKTREIHARSGFDFADFNGEIEENYDTIERWEKFSNEKLQMDQYNHRKELDGPLTNSNPYRHSELTIYSNSDVDDTEPVPENISSRVVLDSASYQHSFQAI